MKKLVLALLGVCCAVMIVPAQEVVSADTIKAVPAYATVDQQPVAQEVEPAKEVKEFRGRRGYFNIGEFYQFNLSSCIRQQNSLTAQFVSFSLSNLANIFYPPQFLQ